MLGSTWRRDGDVGGRGILEHGSGNHQTAHSHARDPEHPARLLAAQPKRFVSPERNRGTRNVLANYYLLAELLGRLSEERKSVYLTDGGHIENLGVYELLRRHCRVIIAVDAEADRELAFGSFNTLVRYARIDLGIEIDLPW